MLNIKEPKKKKGRDSLPIDSMLKLLVYAKIEHVESAKYIADMARYHEVYRFVSDDVKPSERSVQRYRREYGCYFEVLVQMTLKKASDLKLTDFNHVAIDGTIKKAYNSNNNIITKKKKPKSCSITSMAFQLARKCLKNYISLLKKYLKIKIWMLKIK